ncbi:hypothetical protein SADUNF_Sadunf16G0011900 [Salix dunnii]|uniref:Uncharacterized protein n=1 Tax=Salix dunnii TaxID=1413687 RepID=A0A835MP09_9ROSI|nr:hypothetical protein SADUNF_Sadunf16G0011900 [Salix dunnii]
MKRSYHKHTYICTHNSHLFGSYIHHPNYHTLAFHKSPDGHNHGNMALHQARDSIHYSMFLDGPELVGARSLGFSGGLGFSGSLGFSGGLGFSGTLISMLLTALPPLQQILSLIFSGQQDTTVIVTVPAFVSYIWFWISC